MSAPPLSHHLFASLPPPQVAVEVARIVQVIIILTSTLLHLQRCDIVPRCNMDDLTALLHTTAASSDPQVEPGEPLLPDATVVLKVDMRKEAHQSLGGSQDRYTLLLQERWSVPNFISLLKYLK